MSDEQMEESGKKPGFHNFQKHLITTLKRSIIFDDIDDNIKTDNL